MKRFALTLAAAALATALLAPSAQAAFGLRDFDVAFANQDGTPATQAGSHPDEMNISFGINYTGEDLDAVPDGELKTVSFELIPGLVGDPTAYPRCSAADFVARPSLCPPETQVGEVFAVLQSPDSFPENPPVYNLVPPPGVPARLGFLVVGGVPTIVDTGLRPTAPYNLFATLRNAYQVINIFKGSMKVWGVPADPSHDADRGGPVDTPVRPFLTLPRSCEGPQRSSYAAESWEGDTDAGSILTHDFSKPPLPIGFTGCGKLASGFNPTIAAAPTTRAAASASGLDFSIDVEEDVGGLSDPDGFARSDVKRIVATLPEGVTINPSIAAGLGVCAPEQLARESATSAPGEGCPDASRIGSAHVDTPLLDEPLEGSLFLAPQDDPATAAPGQENPFDTLIAFYIVLRNPKLGIVIKIPNKVEPDERTGQLITTSPEVPELPFSHFSLHLREGVHSPLISPPTCGTYTTEALITPHSGAAPVTTTSAFQIVSGPENSPCPPGGVPPFNPGFEAGSVNNNAKSYSPFYMRLIRRDGEQDMTKFSSVLPPGVVGKLAGVSKCSDVQAAVAPSKTGREELASPSCPANSKIGRTLAGAGAGGGLVYVPGSIYLGGPYKGAPLSVIAITPAVAGPFDAGTVVVREALTLNPETAEVEVDGKASDPIPHILNGIPLKLRDLRVYVDRPEFIVNPTSCEPSAAKATLFGSFLDVFNPADDLPVNLQSRYQAANCANLPFKPRLSLKLEGGTKRGGHPGLRALLKANPADANIGGAVVTLPKSAFLDQAHIRTICTRVQFAAKACPKGAEYGYAKAFTPLLEEPLEGPVYLRSSNHKLPDLVVALHGIVDVNIASRIDSFKGGIRSSFENVPDAPVSKFVLTMQSGKKGLIVNSRNLCARKSRVDARFRGQNGKPYNFRPVLKPSCGKGRKRAGHRGR